MEGDEITKLEGIEVPVGFAGDEIGHEIPEVAPKGFDGVEETQAGLLGLIRRTNLQSFEGKK